MHCFSLAPGRLQAFSQSCCEEPGRHLRDASSLASSMAGPHVSAPSAIPGCEAPGPGVQAACLCLVLHLLFPCCCALQDLALAGPEAWSPERRRMKTLRASTLLLVHAKDQLAQVANQGVEILISFSVLLFVAFLALPVPFALLGRILMLGPFGGLGVAILHPWCQGLQW